MAVNFDTIDGVANIAYRGQQAFNVLTGVNYLDKTNLVQQTIDHLQKKIEELESQKNTFLSAFDCSSTEEFKKRVSDYYSNNNLINFTGADLQIIVDEYSSFIDDTERITNENAMQIFNNFLISHYEEYGDDVKKILDNEPIADALAQRVMKDFRATINKTNTGNLQLDAHFDRKNMGDEKTILTLVASQGTKAFKKYVNHAAQLAKDEIKLDLSNIKDKNERRKLKRRFERQVEEAKKLYITTNIDEDNFNLNQNFAFRYGKIIKNGDSVLAGSNAKTVLSETEIMNRNQEIINLICKKLKLSGEYEKYVRERIQMMLTINPTMFFVGKGVTGLEGILGEINAVIAITDLLGDKYKSKALKWIGSQVGESKKQPSIDIVLKEIAGIDFGIQVKNTVKELQEDTSHFIAFADKNLLDKTDKNGNLIDGVLTRAGINSQDIENVYISDTYNVPYKRVGYYYSQVGYNTRFSHKDKSYRRFNTYTTIDEMIDELVDSINLYLSRFASDFIYMANPDFNNILATLDDEITREAKGNFVYIVGSEVFFADEMLHELQTQLMLLKAMKTKEEQVDLQFETYFDKLKDEKKSFNIVEAKNGNGSLSDHTLRMRTSWGFHK